MIWVDPRGRILGRVSVVDLLAALFLLCLAPLAGFGLRVMQPLPPRIAEIQPAHASPGESVRVLGSHFKEGIQASFGETPALSTQYYGTDLVIAYVPPELAPGRYLLTLRNRRGGSASSELEIVLPGPRPQVPVLITCAFTGLNPAEAAILESLSQEGGQGSPGGEPKIVRVLKRGPMSLFSSRPSPSDEGKEYVLADVVLLGEVADASDGRHYFYKNQPLAFKFPLRLSLHEHPFTGVIHRDPTSNRLELTGGNG